MEPKQHTIVIAIILNEKNEVLLAKRYEPEYQHTHDKWEFIGGGIDFGETPEQAVIREAKEEAGIDIKVVRLLPEVVSNIWEFAEGKKQQVIIISYVCKIAGGSLSPNISENVGELKYFSLEDIHALQTLPKVYELAKLALSSNF